MTLTKKQKLKDDFPHEEYPEGIIKLGLSKAPRVTRLIKLYQNVGFKDFDLLEIAELSLSQWKRSDFPIPDGYKASRRRSNLIVKKTSKDRLFK